MILRRLLTLLALFLSCAAFAETDPPRDAHSPARMETVHIPSHRVRINGVLYVAAGAGPHPTMILFHGLPGNEQNLDLAQAIRRTGWTVLTLHYRGAWGSPGTYSYSHQIEDGLAALEFLRDARSVKQYGIDPARIVLAGHSTGGFVAINTAARAPGKVAGLITISASDDAQEALDALGDQKKWAKFMSDEFDDLSGLSGCTARGLAQELVTHGHAWAFRSVAEPLKNLPTLIVTADDGLQAEGDGFGHAMEGAGGHPAYLHFATDHPYSDHRLALQAAVADWLGKTIR
jgi:pimeloyl-ACP methyl ester carboxylesterase